jgi:hypothetical protein
MKSEVLRYLGYSKSNQLPDQSTAILIKSCLEEMLEIQQVKSTYRFFELAKADKQLNVSGTNLTLTSRDIRRHLAHSSLCLLMTVTLGHEVDRRIRYYQKSDLSRAVILDASATASIEQACDSLFKDLELELLPERQILTSRYSPGYRDFPLEIQKRLVETLGASRSVGIAVTATSILIPRKSITAIAGVIDLEHEVAPSTCIACLKSATCQFSKGAKR